VGYNHPSGDPDPSAADVALYQRLRQVGQLIGIEDTPARPTAGALDRPLRSA